MRFISLTLGAAVALSTSLAFAQTQPAAKPAAPAAAAAKPAAPAAAPAAAAAGKFSTGTSQISVLLGDPAAKAVLVKHIPEIANNPQLEQAGGMTLKDIAPMAGPMLSDEKMKAIDDDLAKLPAKK